MDITHPVRAYMLDNAVFVFGTTLMAELDSVEGKTGKEIERKRGRILHSWLKDPSTKPKFKDPAAKK